MSTSFRATSPLALSVAAILALVAALLAPMSPAAADHAVFVVDDPVDAVDADPGDGTCATAAGTCTLRAAVMEANAHGGADTIQLPAGLYELTLVGANEDDAATGDLDVTEALTIVGDGSDTSIIDAARLEGIAQDPADDEAPDRVFHVHNATSFRLEGITARGGNVDGNDPGTQECSELGGTLVCDGGGVYLQDAGASLTLVGSVLRDNHAENDGAGIHVAASSPGSPTTVTLQDSDLIDNQTGDMGEATDNEFGSPTAFSEGGAIFVDDDASDVTLSVTGGTVSGNKAELAGGAVYAGGDDVTISLDGTLVGGTTPAATGTPATANKAGTGGAFFLGGDRADLDAVDSAISGNKTEDEGSPGTGGAIAVEGADTTVDLTGSNIDGNKALGDGGALHITAGDVTLDTVTVDDNKVDGDGGGIHFTSAGTLTIVDSTLDGNHAGGAADSDGGAIYQTDGILDLQRSTLSDNRADDTGGGIWTDAAVTLENVTVSGNTLDADAEGVGGGLYSGPSAVVDIDFTTFSDNATELHDRDNDGLREFAHSDAIFADAAAAVTVNSTIVANSAENFQGEESDNCNRPLTSEGHNLEDDDTCGFDQASDQPNTDPLLGPLADNGGPTETHRLREGSPAIDAGDDTTCPATDQRGVDRPQGEGCDVGAYEADGTTPAPAPDADFTVTKSEDTADGTCDADCSLREAVNAANDTGGPSTIGLPAGLFELTRVGADEDDGDTGDLDVTEDLTILGPGAGITVIDAEQLRGIAVMPADDMAPDRVFDVHGETSLGFEGVTVQEGDVSSADSSSAADAQRCPGIGGTLGSCDGGGVHLDTSGAALTLTDSVLRDNSADNDGGGVFVADGATGVAVTATDSRISGNKAVNRGGVVYLGGSGGTISLDGTVVGGDLAIHGVPDTANKADNQGGAFYLGGDNSTVTANGGAISGNKADSFSASGGAVFVAATGATVDLTDTRVDGNKGDGPGGAVYVDTDVDDVTISLDGGSLDDNKSDDEGGAVYLAAGSNRTLSLSGLSMSRNKADHRGIGDLGGGGALYIGDADADVTLDRVAANDNKSDLDGGAIFTIDDAAETLTILDSTLHGNRADDEGGAIYNDTTASLTNVTISGNKADDEGGGIYNDVNGTLDLLHLTINRNETDLFDRDSDGLREYGDSDALFNGAAAEAVEIQSTIVANSAVNFEGLESDNCEGPTTSLGGNLEDGDSCGFDQASDQTDTDPLLGPLADNGGPTRTHALLAGSPAIDAALDSGCPATDQRGVTRPAGDGCDVGAFEVAADLSVTKSDQPDPVTEGETLTYTIVVTNGGPEPATSVTATDTLPETVTFESSSATQGSCTRSDTTVTCELGDLAAGSDATVTIEVTPQEAGEITNTISVDATEGDPDGADNTASATTTVQPAEAEEQVERLWGDDRFLTAIDISQDLYPDGGAGAVVLARDDVFADALAGTPFAAERDAPLLLTQTSQLRPEVADEIQRVLPGGSTVYLLGGEAALSENVREQVEDLGYQTQRVYGFDRFETAIEIAGELGDPDTLMVATGFEFVDALTAGPAAISADAAILLTHRDTMTPSTQAYLDSRSGEFLYAIGGPDANAYADSSEVDESVYGGDRFATATAVAGEFFTDPPAVGIARSDLFPDSLTGGVHIGQRDGPMLVTPSTSLHGDIESYLCTNAGSIGTAYVYGGVVAISQATEDAVGERIRGEGC